MERRRISGDPLGILMDTLKMTIQGAKDDLKSGLNMTGYRDLL